MIYFATTYAPFQLLEEPSRKNNFNGVYSPEYKEKYRKWMMNLYSTFQKLWRFYDE